MELQELFSDIDCLLRLLCERPELDSFHVPADDLLRSILGLLASWDNEPAAGPEALDMATMHFRRNHGRDDQQC